MPCAEWSRTVRSYLADELWTDRDAYDAAHFLMVPLHAAFESGNEGWQAELRDHFARVPADLPISKRLHRMNYLFLLSRYTVLSGEERWPLREMLMREWDEYLHRDVRRKLDGVSKRRAIGDPLLSAFGVAADLGVSEILDVAEEVFATQGEWRDTGWVYQPGVRTSHPDYAYAGRSEIRPGMTPKPVEGIAPDSSHAHRLPLILRCLGYDDLLAGLERQFFNHILVPGEYPRTNNFMDGRNGVYRYGHRRQARGYGPYELSGTLTLGWWGFLGTERVREMYASIPWPLPDEAVRLYEGPGTLRERHPLVANSYRNGFRELLCRLALSLEADAVEKEVRA